MKLIAESSVIWVKREGEMLDLILSSLNRMTRPTCTLYYFSSTCTKISYKNLNQTELDSDSFDKSWPFRSNSHISLHFHIHDILNTNFIDWTMSKLEANDDMQWLQCHTLYQLLDKPLYTTNDLNMIKVDIEYDRESTVNIIVPLPYWLNIEFSSKSISFYLYDRWKTIRLYLTHLDSEYVFST